MRIDSRLRRAVQFPLPSATDNQLCESAPNRDPAAIGPTTLIKRA
jgi:hypothetical protein